MTRSSHTLIGAAIGATGAFMLPLHMSWCFLVGCVLGANAPDWLEYPVFWGNQRFSVVGHRRITHLLWLWGISIGGVLWLLYFYPLGLVPEMAVWAIGGFAFSGFIHVLLDLFSPTGVPILVPTGKRTSIPIYRTGSISEAMLVIAIIGVIALFNYWKWQSGSFWML